MGFRDLRCAHPGLRSLSILYHAVWGLGFRNEGLGLRVSQGRYKVLGVMRGFSGAFRAWATLPACFEP